MIAPEIVVTLTESSPDDVESIELARSTGAVYDLDAVDALASRTADNASTTTMSAHSNRRLALEIYVWSHDGLRPGLILQSTTLAKLASLPASLRFRPPPAFDPAPAPFDSEAEVINPGRIRPELRVFLKGESPQSGDCLELARVATRWYSPDRVQTSILQALNQGMHGDIELNPHPWKLRIEVWLSSHRGIWPGFSIDASVIRSLASVGTSLEFDPYVA